MLSGNIRRMQYFYLSLKVGREDSSSITGQIFSKLFAIMQTANTVENKQYWFRFNKFIDEISTVHSLISHLLSSLKAIMIFPGSTRFSSSLLSG